MHRPRVWEAGTCEQYLDNKKDDLSAFTLAAGIRNRGTAAKGPAILAAIIGLIVQAHHASQIIADELPVGYTDVVISLVLIIFLLISGITYKEKS